MRRTLALSAALAAAAVFISSAEAQTPRPTHSVVRFFKCNPQGTGIRLFQRARPIVQQMIAEGKFVDYGILAHSWGDEWNVVDYFAVDGIAPFFANFSELTRRIGEANRQAAADTLPPFGEVCTEHKDIIYAIVHPPTGG
jgi:hypothetical protein